MSKEQEKDLSSGRRKGAGVSHFVDKIDNFPFIETTREVTLLKEFEGIE